MKNGLNKVLTLVLALLLVSCFAGSSIFAAEATSDGTLGSILITKYEDNESKKPIEGVTFTLYQMTAYGDNLYSVMPGFEGIFKDMEKDGQIDPNDYDLTKIQDQTDAIAQAVSDNKIQAFATAVTNAEGKAVFSELPEGCWFVQETAAPDYVKEKSANFIVNVPMTNEDGDGLIYDIEVFPKNVVEYPPEPTPEPSTPVYTGISTQTSIFILLGTAVLAGGIALYTAKRKKRQES